MVCRKCGTEIKEGYTFCRKCATPIEDIGDIVIPDINTSTKRTSNINFDKIKDIGSNFLNKHQENDSNDEFIENKDRIVKDQNNKSKATVDTIISVIGIIIGVIVFFIIVFKVASNL
jgi:flagellar biosynthesis/type III secretory pathway M-ring protein FliF/YscJ